MDVRHQGTGRGDERRGRGPLKGPRIEASLEPIGVTDYETHSRHPGKSHPHRGHRLHGLLVEVDLEPVEAVAERLAYIAEREDKPTGRPCEYDEFHFHHQVPGGMVSNLAYQLETLGLGHRIDEILEEAGRVRGDLGYPIVVSPFAQYIVTEATLNVMNAERYKVVPDEVRSYVLGRYGEIPGAIDPDLYDRIARGQEPAKERPGSLLPPTLERVRRERGPFNSDDDLLLAVFYSDRDYAALKGAGPIDTDYPLASTPLSTLVKEIAARQDVRALHFIQRQ